MKRKKLDMEINPGSMADIGFLLLIFFLVSTTIKEDQGILVKLPRYEENMDTAVISDRNLCKILVNEENQLFVRNKEMEIENLSTFLKEFIINPNNNNKYSKAPNKAVLSLQNHRGTKYEKYLQVYNEIKVAYNQLRHEYSLKEFGHAYVACSLEEKKSIQDRIPILLSEAEPFDK